MPAMAINILIELEERDREGPRSPRSSRWSPAASTWLIHYYRLKRQQETEFLDTPRRNMGAIKLFEFFHDECVAESGVYGARSAACHIEYNERERPLQSSNSYINHVPLVDASERIAL